MRYQSLILGAGLVTALLLGESRAWAYVPPSDFLVKSWVAKRKGFKSVRIRTQVNGLNGDKLTGVHFKTSTFVDFGSRILRSSALDDSGKVLYSVERKLGAAEDDSQVPAAAVDELLFDTEPGRVEHELQAIGIPIKTEGELARLPDEDSRVKAETTSVARWKGGFAWVIGDQIRFPEGKKPGTPKPQLWIEKDGFVPFRLIQTKNDQYTDARFDQFRFVRDFPYPRSLTVVRGPLGRPEGLKESLELAVLKDDLLDLAVNPDGAELKKPFATGYTDIGNVADSALRELIRLYFENVR